MKTTDWAWNGIGRRQGYWYIGRPQRFFWFVHYGTTGLWRLKVGPFWRGN
jgi:hypothetical protein